MCVKVPLWVTNSKMCGMHPIPPAYDVILYFNSIYSIYIYTHIWRLFIMSTHLKKQHEKKKGMEWSGKERSVNGAEKKNTLHASSVMCSVLILSVNMN